MSENIYYCIYDPTYNTVLTTSEDNASLDWHNLFLFMITATICIGVFQKIFNFGENAL